MVRIFKKANFNIYSDHDGTYIIHNTNKDFFKGHTHLKEFGTAEYLVNLALHKSIPKRNLKYFIESLIRISTDEEYIDKLMRLSKTKLQKRKRQGTG